MKTTPVMDTPHVGMAPNTQAAYLGRVAPRVVSITAPVRLQQAAAKPNELQRALASSQQEAVAVRRQVADLTETIARLTELVIRREQEVEAVRHFALHDELTGLPNRTLLLDRLKLALVRAKRQQRKLAVLMLDLDGFKNINDALGHTVGDKVLQRVAKRLLSCIRGSDTVCRYGGDEFVLLLPEVDHEKHASQVAQKIRACLAQPFSVDDHSIAVTASIGVAMYPVDATSRNDLIKQADVAMYLAKTVKHASNVHAKSQLASPPRPGAYRSRHGQPCPASSAP